MTNQSFSLHPDLLSDRHCLVASTNAARAGLSTLPLLHTKLRDLDQLLVVDPMVPHVNRHPRSETPDWVVVRLQKGALVHGSRVGYMIGPKRPRPGAITMKYPKRSQYKYAKSRYRVRNWAEYEAGLQMRGDLTVWLSDAALDAWRATPSGKPGGQRRYADIAIEAALTVRMVFHLPLRHTEGFLRSLAQLLELDLPIPDHTTMSRRLQELDEIQFRKLATDRPIHLLIDSTGLRIHVGHLRKPPKNRAWRKMHLAVDADTGKIVASDLTGRRTGDCKRVPILIEQIDNRVASVSADGAYDAEVVYEAARAGGGGRAVRVLIPPGRDAQLNPGPSSALKERNRNILSVRELGRRTWHTRSGYSRRSLVENTMYRYKTIIGRSMRSRTFDGQRVEVQLARKILNTMTLMGMPDSYRVA